LPLRVLYFDFLLGTSPADHPPPPQQWPARPHRAAKKISRSAP
jgi:hypothetical protein